MKGEIREKITEIVLDALFIAFLWIPMMFFDYYMSVACPVMLVSLFFVPVLCGIGMSLLLLSEKGRYALGKGAVALLFSVAPWKIFVNGNFIDRALQGLNRDYDGLSAGGSFGLFFISCIFVAVGGISLLVGVSRSTCDDERPRNEELVRRGRIAARLVGGIVFAYMMLWMSTMPEYVRISG